MTENVVVRVIWGHTNSCVFVSMCVFVCFRRKATEEPGPPSLQVSSDLTRDLTPAKPARKPRPAKERREKEVVEDPMDTYFRAGADRGNHEDKILEVGVRLPVCVLRCVRREVLGFDLKLSTTSFFFLICLIAGTLKQNTATEKFHLHM